MGLNNFKIGTKLTASFVLVAAIFVGVGVFTLFSISSLGDLQDAGAQRAKDAVTITEFEEQVGNAYGIIADAMINRNIKQSKKDFDDFKVETKKELAVISQLVDTEKEKDLVRQYETFIWEYVAIFEKEMLPILEKEESIEARMKDSMEIMKMVIRVQSVYAVMADAIINRDLASTRKDWAVVVRDAREDMNRVKELVDTDEERRLADQFIESYKEYLSVFENRLLPLLSSGAVDTGKVRELDGMLDKHRAGALENLSKINASLEKETLAIIKEEQQLRALDAKIDEARSKTVIPLAKIVESLQAEQAEGDKLYDKTSSSTWTISM
ncbi:MCP four helix bundle domain-containing protein, partial [bacterium]|nr:MCP four helix bundle domain-containing protein [bacterium]